MFFLVLDNLLNWNVLGIRKFFILGKDKLERNKKPTFLFKIKLLEIFS